ncbi:hypothetical protein MRX96_041550 [Rhipicephalus microplus]
MHRLRGEPPRRGEVSVPRVAGDRGETTGRENKRRRSIFLAWNARIDRDARGERPAGKARTEADRFRELLG